MEENEVERPAKKRCTKTSNVQKSLGDGPIRTKVVCLELKRTLKNSRYRKHHTKIFNELARFCGGYRYITGLFANYVCMRKIEQNLELPKLNKLFFDRCWTSLEMQKSKNIRQNPMFELAKEFVRESGFDTNLFPPIVRSTVRESITREMETVVNTYISENVGKKVRSHIRRKLSVMETYKNMNPKYQPFIVSKVSDRCLDRTIEISTSGELGIYHGIICEVRGYISEAWNCDQCTGKNLKYVLKTRPEYFLRLISFMSTSCEERRNKYSLLPIWKLQPAMIYYSNTVVKGAFGKLYSTLQNFTESNFDVDRVSAKGYVINGFRTDGYQVQLSYIALKTSKPVPLNTDSLSKSGYQFPKKSFDVPIRTSGLFCVHQSRMDAKKIKASDVPYMRITSVDPGCSEIVSVRTTPLKHCGDPVSIVQNSNVWSMSGQEYSTISGRTMLEHREELRRKNIGYRTCLERFRNVTSKTCVIPLFMDYVRIVAITFKGMYAEKTKSARKRSRLHSSRMVQSTIDRLAQKISTSGSDKSILSKNIVLFGDGTFRPQRGHASAPRKSIVRALSHRCVVGIMDEFRTSMMCPGGCGKKMEDVEDERRMRQCPIVPGSVSQNCLLSGISETGVFKCDRDESSTINFCRIGYSSLVDKTWPEYLLRDF